MNTRNRRKDHSHKAGTSGLWTYDIKADLFFGDHDVSVFMGRTDEESKAGFHMYDAMTRVHEQDRERVMHAFQQSASAGVGFREEYKIRSAARGERQILAVGRCFIDENGTPSHLSGWFIDIVDGAPRLAALRIAAHHVEQAGDATRAAGDDFVTYLLDNVQEELEGRLS